MFWTFQGWEIQFFLSLKVDGKMIFTGYWKVLDLGFEKLFFWTFRRWEIRSFFWAIKLMERWYLLGLFELSNMFQDLGNMAFVQCTQSKWVPSVKNGKSGHHYWFSTFELVFVSNFSLYWQFWIFLTKFTISNFFARRKTVVTVF